MLLKLLPIGVYHFLKVVQMFLKVLLLGRLTLGEGMQQINPGDITDVAAALVLHSQLAPELKSVPELMSSQLKSLHVQLLGQPGADPIEEDAGDVSQGVIVHGHGTRTGLSIAVHLNERDRVRELRNIVKDNAPAAIGDTTMIHNPVSPALVVHGRPLELPDRIIFLSANAESLLDWQAGRIWKP